MNRFYFSQIYSLNIYVDIYFFNFNVIFLILIHCFIRVHNTFFYALIQSTSKRLNFIELYRYIDRLLLVEVLGKGGDTCDRIQTFTLVTFFFFRIYFSTFLFFFCYKKFKLTSIIFHYKMRTRIIKNVNERLLNKSLL